VEFEWDEEKGAANVSKHGVSFEEAKTVFGDSLYVDFTTPITLTMSIDTSSWASRTGAGY